MKTTVLYNQCLFDISIQEHGTIEAVFGVAQANGLGITDTITPGERLRIPTEGYGARAIAQHFKSHRIYPTTADVDSGSDSNQKLFENGLFENGLFE